jgi:pyrroline-5-carboxylate reductase
MTTGQREAVGSLLVIGGGNMGSAIVRGAVRAGVLDPHGVVVVDPDPARHADFASLGAAGHATLDEGLKALEAVEGEPGSAAVLLAVKPQMLADVSEQARGRLGKPPRLVMSILAGTTTERLASALGGRTVRLMPNTPAMIGEGITALCPGPGAGASDEAMARRLFEAVGRVVALPEDLLDAFTGVAGSGPAYIFLLAEGMLAGAEAVGFDRRQGLELVRATLRGAALLLDTEAQRDPASADPARLRAMVTSKGGTTAAATAVLERHGMAEALREAVVAARDRGRELAGA